MGFLNFYKNHILKYPTPSNLNFNWSYGSIAGFFLVIQLITGVLLSFHYIPTPEMAFWSIERTIMRDVQNGWLVRYMHMNGASFFFLAVYFHIARSLYYRTYIFNKKAWFTGVSLFILLIVTAFLGYVLPWSQMSYWAATVITNLFSSVPIVGQKIVYWIWGGYAVNDATLKRFFALHFLFSIVIAVLTVIHIYYVHIKGSTNSLCTGHDTVPVKFGIYFTSKDAFAALLIFFVFMTVVLLYPLELAHPDQFIKANTMVTPKHIVPEWYFLPFYAILRSVPNKELGIVLLAFSLIILFLLPSIDKSKILIHPRFCIYHEWLFFFFIYVFAMLGHLGGMPATEPYVLASKVFTAFYFLFFIFLGICSRAANNIFARKLRLKKKATRRLNA